MIDVSRIKGVIFDLGETLIAIPDDQDEDLLIAEYCGLSLQQIQLMTREICWNNKRLSENEFAHQLTVAICEMGKNCSINEVQNFFERSIVNMIVQCDAMSTLSALKKVGMKLAVVSNSNPLSHKRLDRSGVRPLLDCVLLSCDTGFWKPDPRAYMCAFDELQTAAEDMLIVGDRTRTLALGAIQTGAQIALLERRT